MCAVTVRDQGVKRKKISPFIKQCFVTAAVCSNVVNSGCIVGFPGVMLPQLQKPGSIISVSTEQASWLASSASAIAIFGAFVTTPVMSRAGRKMAHYVVLLVSLLSWVIAAFANSYEVLLLGRIVQGVSFGMYLPLRSVLIGELTSPRHRGGFLTAISLSSILGVLFIHGIGTFLSYQMTALASVLFLVISLVFMIISPESPSWLATQGQYDKCRENFIWLRGDEEEPELATMIQAAKHHRQEKCKLDIVATVKKKEFYKPIFLMFAMYTLCSYSGVVLLAVYPVPILKYLKGDIDANFWMVIIDIQRLFFGCVSVYSIHKIKRRTMVFATGALCACCQLSISAYVFAKSWGYCFDSLWFPMTLFSLQIIALSLGSQPLPPVIAGEVYPLQNRGLAGSIGLIAYAGTTFIVVKTFPGLTELAGFHGAYALYSGIVVACLVTVWFLLPETSVRTLQQIEEHFRGEPRRDLEAGLKETVPLNEAEEAKNLSNSM